MVLLGRNLKDHVTPLPWAGMLSTGPDSSGPCLAHNCPTHNCPKSLFELLWMLEGFIGSSQSLLLFRLSSPNSFSLSSSEEHRLFTQVRSSWTPAVCLGWHRSCLPCGLHWASQPVSHLDTAEGSTEAVTSALNREKGTKDRPEEGRGPWGYTPSCLLARFQAHSFCSQNREVYPIINNQ